MGDEWPLRGRGQGHVTYLLNFGIHFVTFERVKLEILALFYMSQHLNVFTTTSDSPWSPQVFTTTSISPSDYSGERELPKDVSQFMKHHNCYAVYVLEKA